MSGRDSAGSGECGGSGGNGSGESSCRNIRVSFGDSCGGDRIGKETVLSTAGSVDA